MSGGGSGSSTTVQKADPWKGAQPFLFDYMNQAQGLSQTPQSYFPGQTYAGFDPNQAQAYSRMAGITNDPNSATNQAVGQMQDTINGNFLPGGDAMRAAITDPTINQVNAMFSKGGRYGSGAHEQALGQGITQAMMPYWDAERGRQMTASAAAPSMEMGALAPQLQAGQAYQGMSQQAINDAMARFNFAQDEPNQRLQRYASLVSPGAGFGSTSSGSTTMPQGSRVAGAAGGMLGAGMGMEALGMASMANPLFWPVLAGGGLLGAFG